MDFSDFSFADLIADTALARKGYPRIGISACFGGPLFSILTSAILVLQYPYLSHISASVSLPQPY